MTRPAGAPTVYDAPKGASAQSCIVLLKGRQAVAPTLASSADAIAATDLNIRSGPCPQFSVVGTIPGGEQTSVDGCLAESSWCKVMYDGVEGWSYSDYLAVGAEEQAVVLTTRPATVGIKTVTYENTEATQTDQNTGATIGAGLLH